MGQQRQKRKPFEVSDLDSDFNPYYNELQNFLIEMHGDAMNAFKKTSSQKRTILKLEVGNLKTKEDFEFLTKSHLMLMYR